MELKLITDINDRRDLMVGNTTLLHIHQRLKKVFDTNNSQLLLLCVFIIQLHLVEYK